MSRLFIVISSLVVLSLLSLIVAAGTLDTTRLANPSECVKESTYWQPKGSISISMLPSSPTTGKLSSVIVNSVQKPLLTTRVPIPDIFSSKPVVWVETSVGNVSKWKSDQFRVDLPLDTQFRGETFKANFTGPVVCFTGIQDSLWIFEIVILENSNLSSLGKIQVTVKIA
jgi:hypothetical protein